MRTHVMVFMLLVATDAANAQWSQQGSKLVGTQGLYPTQGSSVSLSADGNTAIVGGPYDYDANQHPVGAAWVFTRSCGVWSQQGSKLVGTGGSVFGAIQGISVSLSADGNTAIVGGSMIMVTKVQSGCSRERVASGASKAANLSAPVLWVLQIKALQFLFPRTGIQPS